MSRTGGEEPRIVERRPILKLTPIQKETGKRLLIEYVRMETYGGRPNGRGAWVGVLTVEGGKQYKIKGRACDLPSCFCDAEIIGYDGPIVIAPNARPSEK